MATAWKPKGFHSITPYLIVDGAAALIAFMEKAFGATVDGIMNREDGKVLHSLVQVGDSKIEVSDATAEFSPMKAAIHLYVEDADAVYAKAVEAGASTLRAPGDKPYGDREADIIDPCGNHWYIATHREDVSAEEFQRRMTKPS